MNLTGAFSKLGLTIKKHSPEILGAIGIAATVGGVVWACKVSVDAAEEIKSTQKDVEEIKQAVKDDIIDKKEGNKRIWSARVECFKCVGVKFVGPVVLIGGGLYCHTKSRQVLGKRLNGLAAAYTALESRNKLLEDNIRRDYGEEELERLKYGLTGRTGPVKRLDADGNEIEREETANCVIDLNNVKPFTIIFDNKSRKHRTSKYHCETYLGSMEKTFTDLLPTKKVIWLDWAMDQLDIHPANEAEALAWHSICWTYKPGAKGNDNVVKFRWKQVVEPDAEQFDIDYNPVYILDPNYDTNINQKWYQPRD